MRTPSMRLADILLDEPVDRWIAEQRASGLSWRRIAFALRDATDGQLEISDQTLISWGSTQNGSAA